MEYAMHRRAAPESLTGVLRGLLLASALLGGLMSPGAVADAQRDRPSIHVASFDGPRQAEAASRAFQRELRRHRRYVRLVREDDGQVIRTTGLLAREQGRWVLGVSMVGPEGLVAAPLRVVATSPVRAGRQAARRMLRSLRDARVPRSEDTASDDETSAANPPAAAPVVRPASMPPDGSPNTDRTQIQAPEPRDPRPDGSGRARSRPGVAPGLDVALYAGVMSRRYDYRDDLFDRLRSHRVPLGAMLSGRVRLHPSAFEGATTSEQSAPRARPAWAPSLTFGYGHSLVMRSQDPAGQTFTTAARALEAGAGLRYSRGSVAIAGGATFVQRGLTLHLAGPDIGGQRSPVPDIPDVRYRAIAPTVAVSGVIGAWRARLEALVVRPFSLGDLRSDVWFPRAEALGVELRLELGFRVHANVELRGYVEYRHVAIDLGAQPGDRRVAGGARDDYLVIGVGTALLR